jgi:Mg-chelatase subunit ChlD
MGKMKSLLCIILLFAFGSINMWGDAVVYLDPEYSMDGQEVRLTTESLMDPNFPQPGNNLPVLFVHGHNFELEEGKNFKKNWQQSLNGLPSFRETLELQANAPLGIEPYYIDLEDYTDDNEKKNRTIREDAEKIKEAVQLVLLHQGDPGAQTKKVVIIAYSRGTISARYYLKTLWENQNRRLDFHPVSEFIAISPPNHGTDSTALFIETTGKGSLALKQINNGYKENCGQFSDPLSHDFIQNLNGHDIQDTMAGNYCGQVFESEAPGARRKNEPVEKGILYVTLYARGNRDAVGGGTPSADCQGRVLAKNLSPYAENREVPGIANNVNYPEIPGGIFNSKITVHQNTVHMPEVICKALYTAVHHQAPPDELEFETADANNRNSAPVIPGLQTPQRHAGAVLLFDMSGSMSWAHDGTRDTAEDKQRITLAKRAAEPFLILANQYLNGRANLGIVGFPRFPWSMPEVCASQLINSMIPVTESGIEEAIRTVNCLEGHGNTPLLNGLDAAVQMFGNENRKAIVLLSDGYHNCPRIVDSGSEAVVNRIAELDNRGIFVYTIGFGDQVEIDHELLRKLAEDRDETLKGKFVNIIDAGFDPERPGEWDPGMELNKTYNSIFAHAFDLAEAMDPAGIIKAGETSTIEVKIGGYDRKASFILGWAAPQKGRLRMMIETPDGRDIPGEVVGVHIHEGDTYTIITVDEQLLNQMRKVDAAAWQLVIDAPGLKNGEKENYYCSVIMDSALKMKTGFDRPVYGTGDVMTFTAAVTAAGQPIKGLTDVTVTLTRPADGPGNWYALNKVSAEELKTIPDTFGDETISRLYRKTVFLKEKRKAALPGRTRPLTLRLYDDGSHGDKKSGDGIYTNQYPETTKEGTYCFRFRAVGSDFEREKEVRKYVVVKPDPAPEYSFMDIQWMDMDIDEANRVYYFYDVTVVPRDRYGNHAGPGRSIEAEVVYDRDDRGNESFKLEDLLDGTYRGEIRILRSGLKAGAKLVFSIDGKTFTAVTEIPKFKRWSLGIGGGMTIPTTSLNVNYNKGFGLGGHIGYYLAPQFALVGRLGYNRFKAGSPAAAGDMYWWTISGNLKSEIPSGSFRFYINAGPGVYIPKSGNPVVGFNAGAGVSYPIGSNWALAFGADYHHIFTQDLDTKFILTHIMFNYRF